MMTLAEHLKSMDPLDYFAPSEMSHLVLFVYEMLQAATRERCDRIAFTGNDVTWSRDGLPIRQRFESPLQSVTFRETMRRIVERDPVVRAHLHLVRQDATLDSYQILYPELAAIGASARGEAASRQPIDRS
jgi:hypothetical protein